MSVINGLQREAFSDGIHPNLKLLSHSSDTLLHKCPKKYELYKLGGKLDGEDNDQHLTFGDVVGVGVQDYLLHSSVNSAALTMFMRWHKMLDDEDGVRDKKTFWHCLYALDKFEGLRNSQLSHYELAAFNGKPALELGFSIDLGDGFFYRGFLDALFIDKIRNSLKVYEGKTTKFRNIHAAMFQNSGQGLGYSLVVDAISKQLGMELGSSYDVLYAVYKTGAYEWETFNFSKSHTQRAMWLKNLLRDKQHIAEYAWDDYFPMHGENCFDFFRPCPHFGSCEISSWLQYPKPVLTVDDQSKYQFHFTLEELIDAQLAI